MPNITITPHLAQQAAMKSIGLEVVRAVLSNPSCTYPSFQKVNGQRVPYTCRKCGKQQEKWTGQARDASGKQHKVCVVVNPCCGEAITVWADQVETAIRPDQRRNGVTGYVGRDGRWRQA